MKIERYTERAQGFLQAAQAIAMREGHPQFTPEHILKALLDDPEGMAAGLIDRAGGDARQAHREVDAFIERQPKVSGSASQPQATRELMRLFETAEKAADKASDKFVTVERLLLALAIEKDTEAGRILARAGVTASALNEAINAIRKGRTADSASAENAYEALKKYARDLTEAARDGKLDPVIGRDDEIHTLVGAGKADGAMDASNLLKPALARGELHCVGATTLDEYRKHVEKDAALARRFQPVFVSEPTVEDTVSILRGLKEKYEQHHGVRITDSALVAAATLSNRYITDRFLPDKAIDLVDEASSRLRMQVDSKPEEIDELDRRIIQLKIEREALKKEKDRASQDRLKALEEELANLEQQSAELTTRWQG